MQGTITSLLCTSLAYSAIYHKSSWSRLILENSPLFFFFFDKCWRELSPFLHHMNRIHNSWLSYPKIFSKILLLKVQLSLRFFNGPPFTVIYQLRHNKIPPLHTLNMALYAWQSNRMELCLSMITVSYNSHSFHTPILPLFLALPFICYSTTILPVALPIRAAYS